MPEDLPPPTNPPPVSDVLFKRYFIVFTAVSLAVVYGWLAGFERMPGGSLTFHWRWVILPWALVGLVSGIYFWRKMWPPPNRPPVTRKDIIEGVIALVLPGVWWLIFPLRTLSGQHLWDVTKGLVAAAVVLSFGAWMIIRLGRGFEDSGNPNPDDQSHGPGTSNDKNSER
jgi:hypothetical protein